MNIFIRIPKRKIRVITTKSKSDTVCLKKVSYLVTYPHQWGHGFHWHTPLGFFFENLPHILLHQITHTLTNREQLRDEVLPLKLGVIQRDAIGQLYEVNLGKIVNVLHGKRQNLFSLLPTCDAYYAWLFLKNKSIGSSLNEWSKGLTLNQTKNLCNHIIWHILIFRM